VLADDGTARTLAAKSYLSSLRPSQGDDSDSNRR
jgi:hypothetical protein